MIPPETRSATIGNKSAFIGAIGAILLAIGFIVWALLPHGNKVVSDEPTPVFSDSDHVGSVLKDGKIFSYAPMPEEEFRNASCDLTPNQQVTEGTPNSWSIPHIGQTSELTVSGDSGVLDIPDAPKGTIYSQDAQLGDTQGAIFQAGHVDYAPGALSDQGGELSPWGYLHKVKPCTRVYQFDENGTMYEFVITDLYTVGQNDLASQEEMFRLEGDLALYMVTCSGATVDNTGGSENTDRIGFNFEYNLVVKAVPVSA